MNLLADASVAAPIVARLRLRGHTVSAVSENDPAMADEDVLAFAYLIDAILLTEDKDFGDLVVRRRLQTHGIVLLRLSQLPRAARSEFVCSQLERIQEKLRGAVTVIDAGQVRIRPIGE